VRALAIETATRIASVAIVVDDEPVAERSVPMSGSHARTLMPLVDAVLEQAGIGLGGIDLLAVSIGPGSFTGLRIGLAAAKGLALARRMPIVGVPTLEAYAQAAGERRGAVCPVLDARKGEVYAAVFRWRGGELVGVRPATALAPERVARSLRPPCILVGDGVDAYTELWRGALGGAATLIPLDALPPSAAAVGRLGIARAGAGGPDDVARLEPQYCRLSEAESSGGRRAGIALGGDDSGAWKN